ncbi:DUF3054 domain-containing protein [Lapillicoccus sp.]|uniref:DUF3054 domain-containing protein n=1 Tax=Lapillicoccus sp. TaxID=1909287 RepID=UPI0039832001
MSMVSTGRSVTPVAAAALDAVIVLVFAAVGRASHDEGSAAVGVLVVAWPFLVGAAAGWALWRWRSGRWPVDVRPGLVVWAGTLVGGMLLRVVTGAGTAFSFVVVAALFLALGLLGWRALLPRVLPRR